VLRSRLFKDYVFIKENLDNYDGITNPKEHIKKMQNILELVKQDNNSLYKFLSTIFHGSIRV
jgi:hypothetical protein